MTLGPCYRISLFTKALILVPLNTLFQSRLFPKLTELTSGLLHLPISLQIVGCYYFVFTECPKSNMKPGLSGSFNVLLSVSSLKSVKLRLKLSSTLQPAKVLEDRV